MNYDFLTFEEEKNKKKNNRKKETLNLSKEI